MKKLSPGVLCLSTLLASFQVTASESAPSSQRNWSIGSGFSDFSLSNANADFNYDGLSFSVGYAPNNNVQIKGGYFTLHREKMRFIESKGADLMAYYGAGFTQPGFKVYAGGGLFTDQWRFTESESFTGVQVGAGLGYNWGAIGFDLVVAIRQANQYEDLVNENDDGSYLARSTNAAFSYMF